MAEEAPKVQNKGLLLVAVALGAVVVVIYNFHINAVRNEGKGQSIRLLRLTTSKEIGKELEEKDLEEVPIQLSDAKRLGNIVEASSKGFVLKRTIRQTLSQGQWLLWEHLEGTPSSSVLTAVPKEKVVLTMEVSPKYSPGPMLEPGGRVHICGTLSLAGKPPKYYRIMENVKVLATGTNLLPQAGDPTVPRDRTVIRSYRTIAIMIDQKASLQLMNILSRLPEVVVEVVSPKAVPPGDSAAEKINPELSSLAETAVTGRPGMVEFQSLPPK